MIPWSADRRFDIWPICIFRLWIAAAWFFKFVSVEVINVCVVAVSCCIISSKLGFFSWCGGHGCCSWKLFAWMPCYCCCHPTLDLGGYSMQVRIYLSRGYRFFGSCSRNLLAHLMGTQNVNLSIIARLPCNKWIIWGILSLDGAYIGGIVFLHQ